MKINKEQIGPNKIFKNELEYVLVKSVGLIIKTTLIYLALVIMSTITGVELLVGLSNSIFGPLFYGVVVISITFTVNGLSHITRTSDIYKDNKAAQLVFKLLQIVSPLFAGLYVAPLFLSNLTLTFFGWLILLGSIIIINWNSLPEITFLSTNNNN